jgi:uncharacterized repeat protein (TIGR03806 family)
MTTGHSAGVSEGTRRRRFWTRLGFAAVPLVVGAAIVGGACGSDDSPGASGAPAGNGPGGVASPARSRFGLDVRPSNTTCVAPARPPSAAPVALQRVFANVTLGGASPFLNGPMVMAQPPGDKTRWLLARRDGVIVTFPSNRALDPTPYDPPVVVDVAAQSGKPVLTDGEQGLHAIAFHPSFAQNGRLYVSFITTGPGGGAPYETEIGYLTSLDGGASFTGPYNTVLTYPRETPMHNGGSLAFGKDGYLYMSAGDGVDSTLPQFMTSLRGKVLRIDVDDVPPGKTYGIPKTNPFAGGGGLPEIFAWGFRNPFRLTIDRATGDVWVGDVGQDSWEEIDRVERGGNYGWPCREGAHDAELRPERCPSRSGLIDPIWEYAHEGATAGGSVTGGYVYRGTAITGFQGTYVYGDFITKRLSALTFDGAAWKSTLLNPDGPADGYTSFAEDDDGEIYVISLVDEVIYKLVPKAASAPSTFPDRLSKTGCVDTASATRLAAGVIPYGVNAPLWSDGADKERWMALPDGKTITVGADGDFDLPAGSVLGKTFSLGGKRIETRLYVRHDDGDWAGYAYEWNDEQTDAVLLPSSKAKAVGAQTWTIPSRTDCARCHTPGAGRSLGLEIGQLNGDMLYPSTKRTANQLATLEHIGMLTAPLGAEPPALPAYPRPFGDGPLEARARAYLHANCSGCHRPNGGAARSTMDLRFAVALEGTNTCLVAPTVDNLGQADASILRPGAPERSILALRLHATDAKRMPPLGRQLVHTQGATLIDDWIRAIAACPGQE